MTTMVIDRQTPIDTLFSFVGAEKIELVKSGTGVVFTPVVCSNDTPERNARREKIRKTFDKCRIDLSNFKFDRDEANDYD